MKHPLHAVATGRNAEVKFDFKNSVQLLRDASFKYFDFNTAKLMFQPTANGAIQNDRQSRHIATKFGKNVASTPKWGFFGTIFQLIVGVRYRIVFENNNMSCLSIGT